MIIDNISSVSTISRTTGEISNPQTSEKIEKQSTELAAAEDSVNEETTTAENQPKTRGVIRNLLNGHYKGVADVRLRINFHEELAAMEQAELAASAETEIGNLENALRTEIDKLLELPDLTEEKSAGITDTINILYGEIEKSAAEFTDIETASAELSKSFDNFIINLNEHFAVPEEVVIEETAVETELAEQPIVAETDEELPEEPAAFDYDTFITGLKELFVEVLENMKLSLSEVSVLPEITEPKGNGAAFEKFMEIYNEMRSGEETEPEEPMVDLVS